MNEFTREICRAYITEKGTDKKKKGFSPIPCKDGAENLPAVEAAHCPLVKTDGNCTSVNSQRPFRNAPKAPQTASDGFGTLRKPRKQPAMVSEHSESPANSQRWFRNAPKAPQTASDGFGTLRKPRKQSAMVSERSESPAKRFFSSQNINFKIERL